MSDKHVDHVIALCIERDNAVDAQQEESCHIWQTKEASKPEKRKHGGDCLRLPK